MNKSFLYLLLLLFCAAPIMASREKVARIRPFASYRLDGIAEPSDIVLCPDGQSFIIVSDDGYIYRSDLQGKIRATSPYRGLDFEGVCIVGETVYAAEELSRNIALLNLSDLSRQRVVNLAYNGARNMSYEAITFNRATSQFLLFTEKHPIYMFVLDSALNVVDRVKMSHIARDMSAATFYDEHLWLLSDEDMTIFKLNPTTYEVLGRWRIPVVNPEGLTFDAEGNIVVVSDAMSMMYYFKNPDKK